jgi:hypothetical protein
MELDNVRFTKFLLSCIGAGTGKVPRACIDDGLADRQAHRGNSSIGGRGLEIRY